MPKQIESTFTRYSFDEVEAVQAAIFSDLQRMYLKNELALVAEKKIALLSTDENFIQNEAMYAGQMQILQYLLDASEAALTIAATSNQPQ